MSGLEMLGRKGYFYFGVGTFFLLLVVIYIFIALTDSALATEITQALGTLFSAIKG